MLYNNSFLAKDKNKFTAFFKEMFVGEYVATLKNCKIFEKKIYCLKLLYSFFDNTYASKHEAIILLNEHLKDEGLFIQALSILVKEEKEINEQNTELVKYF